jgi:NADH-quinone oxidoreductase subunit J
MMGGVLYTIVFYAFAAIAIALAFAVVMEKQLLRAAVALMGVLAVCAGFYLMLGAEFLAGVQVLVYVGGIVVLIVFAIMVTLSAELQEDRPDVGRRLLGGAASLAFFLLTAGVLMTQSFAQNPGGPPPGNNTEAIGLRLLDYGATGYVLPFEVVSILLLVAILGGIVIARKTPPLDQPFTSGGDAAGEVDITRPKSQDEDQWEGDA